MSPTVYVKIETNHGITGWGEINGLDPTGAEPLAESLFELIDGENPTRIEHLWQKIYRAHRDMRGGPFMVHTISRHRHGPVGHRRQALGRAGLSAAGRSVPRPHPRLSHAKARQGPAPAASIHAAPRPTSTAWSPHGRGPAKRVGPDGAVMFDAHCAVPPPTLIQFAAAIEPYDVLFIEEPAVPGNIEVFKRLKEQIRIPLAAGERDRTIWEHDPLSAEPLPRHPAARLRPHRRHHADEEDRHAGRGLPSCRWRRTAPPQLGISASLHVAAVGAAVPDPRVLPRRPHHAAGRRPQAVEDRRRRLRLAAARARAWASRSTNKRWPKRRPIQRNSFIGRCRGPRTAR